jgi:hypothetical protein
MSRGKRRTGRGEVQHAGAGSGPARERPSAPPAGAPELLERFQQLPASRALWIVLGITLVMLAFVYRDFLTLGQALLYEDIGSDSAQFYYPTYVQQAKLWQSTGATLGYSLEQVMGDVVRFSPWDPFQWAVVLAGPERVHHVLAFVEMSKVLATAALAFGFFRLQPLRNLSAAVGSLCFAFCGYITLCSSGWFWLSSGVVWLVLLLWATEHFLSRSRLRWVVLPLAVLVVVRASSYWAIYLSAALLAYALVRLTAAGDWKRLAKQGGLYAAAFGAGLLLSFDALLDLKEFLAASGRSESLALSGGIGLTGSLAGPVYALAQPFEYVNLMLRSYSNNLMGAGDAFKGMINYLEAPILYTGLPTLLFIPFFFRGADLRTKVVYGLLLALAALFLVFPWFRRAFWGFRLDYFREYTLLIGAFLLIVAIRGFERFSAEARASTAWISLAAVAAAFGVLHLVQAPPGVVDGAERQRVTLFLLGLGAAMVAYHLTRDPKALGAIALLAAADLALNADKTINDRDVLTAAEIEQGKLFGGDSRRAVEWVRAQDTGLYRIATYGKTLNDAMVQGFPGLVGYASNHNANFLRLMAELECIDRTKHVDMKWVHRARERPYLVSLLGGKYLLMPERDLEFDPQNFPLVHRIGDVRIYRAETALPLLVAYDSYVLEADYRKLGSIRTKDYVLFRALVVGADQLERVAAIQPFPLESGLPPVALGPEYLAAAEERRSLMDVSARPARAGLTAELDVRRACVVVVQLPFDERLVVSVDGVRQETFVGNFGLLAFTAQPGKHAVEVRYQP